VLEVISQEKSKLSLVVLPVLSFCLFFNIAFSAAHVASLSLATTNFVSNFAFLCEQAPPPLQPLMNAKSRMKESHNFSGC
jgi:hypothetical protein